MKTLRLILGDQLNSNHSWFEEVSNDVTYILMEIRQETDYTTHHIQKVAGFFASMRNFAKLLKDQGHNVRYLKISDTDNSQSLTENIRGLVDSNDFQLFEYQFPDEFRLDEMLLNFSREIDLKVNTVDTEHFYTTREEVADFFGKKNPLMESFYRHMRKKHDILMESGKPLGGKWNYDAQNRKKIPKGHRVADPYLFSNDLTSIVREIEEAGVETIGTINENEFPWPVSRQQSLQLLDHFVKNYLKNFGQFQDAIQQGEWSLYHSRLSFSMNTKMLSPKEVIDASIAHWKDHTDEISLPQIEGFVRQILGWREFMRGIYWKYMPEYESFNHFEFNRKLPDFFWSGDTKMNCLSDAINQSLDKAYAHHIQRLMVTGNFALLAGVDPDEVDAWYLGIYIDAVQWVEITNTRGMSQYADGGIIGTKPYVSSANYIHKMSNLCGSCHYDRNKRHGEKACPFNSLYWNFLSDQEKKLRSNPRMSMIYRVMDKMGKDEFESILKQADHYLNNVNEL